MTLLSGPRTCSKLEWHCRRRLPHWEAGQRPQSITFRLADSMPAALLAQWRDELAWLVPEHASHVRRQRIEEALDQGLGPRFLENPGIAVIVEEALLRFDEQRYHLHAWCIMPTHVHVLASPAADRTLSEILHSWKSFTAKAANRALGRKGSFWAEEYFDRVIRDDDHYGAVHAYIVNNPVKAGLCAAPEDWPFGSARRSVVLVCAGAGS
jgi:putative DNA methylase